MDEPTGNGTKSPPHVIASKKFLKRLDSSLSSRSLRVNGSRANNNRKWNLNYLNTYRGRLHLALFCLNLICFITSLTVPLWKLGHKLYAFLTFSGVNVEAISIFVNIRSLQITCGQLMEQVGIHWSNSLIGAIYRSTAALIYLITSVVFTTIAADQASNGKTLYTILAITGFLSVILYTLNAIVRFVDFSHEMGFRDTLSSKAGVDNRSPTAEELPSRRNSIADKNHLDNGSDLEATTYENISTDQDNRDTDDIGHASGEGIMQDIPLGDVDFNLTMEPKFSIQ